MNKVTHNFTRTKLSLSILASLFVLSPCNLVAQEEESDKRDDQVLVITSTHREENIQEVPLTVTALGAETLKKSDISGVDGIAQRVPGISYGEFSAGQPLISIRGISSVDDGAGLEYSVANFLDGVYIGRGASINFDMYDLDRIEVVRGPQGTLFGRNAIGGAFNVVTSKPTAETQAKFGLTLGNEGIFRAQGLVSGSITDDVAGKISFSHREHDGYVDNVLLGTKLQDEDSNSIRGQLRFSGDGAEWLLSADYMEDDRADMGRTVLADKAPLTAIMAANGVTGPRQNAAPYDGYSLREAGGISLQGDIEFDNGVLTSITAYRTAETDWEMQSVGAGLGALGLPFDEVVDAIIEDLSTFSQELRWASDLEGNFNYTAGIYLYAEETDRTEQFKITAAGSYDGFTMTSVGSQAIIGNEYTRTENETKSFAVYGEGGWRFEENWNLIFGARYTYDEKDYVATAADCGNLPTTGEFANFSYCEGLGGSLNIINETFRVTPSDSWDDISFKLALQHFVSDDVMLFGSVTTGFKSGGFAGSQGVEASASNPVSPETATNYELGFKGDLADGALRLNATAFYTDYTDLQIVRFGPVPQSTFGTFVTANIGEADISGFELEWGWYPNDNFRLLGNFAALDTEINGLLIETTGGMVDASGSALRQAPDSSYNILAGYTVWSDSGEFDFQIEYSHMDEQITDYIDQRTVIQQHSLLDMRVAWTSNDEAWEVALWGKNMAEEDYISHSYVIGPGVIGVWGAPRTTGITVTYTAQ